MPTVPVLIAEEGVANIVIDRPAIVIGRSRRRSDVRIDNRSISAVHCEITVGENCLQIRNRGLNGIRINGRKSDSGILRDGDVLEIARLKFRVLMKGDARFPNASELSSNNDWYVRLAGMELGPMPWAELSLMAQRGELTRSDEVRWSRQRNWIPAASADGLFESDEDQTERSRPPATNDRLAPLSDTSATKPHSDSHSVQPHQDKPGPETTDESHLQPTESNPGEVPTIHSETADISLIETMELSTDAGDSIDVSVSSLKPAVLPHQNQDGHHRHKEPADRVLSRDDEGPAANDFGINLTGGLEQTTDSGDSIDAELTEVADSDEPAPAPAVTPIPIQSTIRARPTPPVSPPVPPPFRPVVGRSDTFFDRIYDAVIDPVLVYAPALRTWPGITAIVAGIVIALFLMQPSYEGAKVSGKVTLNGLPLADATISFTDLKNGFGASAVLRSDGTFEVATLKGGMKPGTYSIAVMPVKTESPEVIEELQRQYSESLQGVGQDEAVIPEEHTTGQVTDRSAVPDDDAAVQLPPATIPFQYRSIQTSGIQREITAEGPNVLQIDL